MGLAPKEDLQVMICGPRAPGHAAAEFTPCLADLNGDGIVDLGDSQVFAAMFLAGC
ncbi:MAG: hypothetical protein ACI89L_000671 [Phycisphaerales bacterium]|jgi:hypothetical protein